MPARITPAIALAVTAFVAPPATAAETSTGGMAASDGPRIISVRCITRRAAACPTARAASPGAQLQLRGQDMQGVRTVVFRGGRGQADDIKVRARHVRPTHVEAVVPAAARTGRLEVRARFGDRAVTTTPVKVVKPAPETATAAAPSGPQVFPIRGKHDLGQSSANAFGGGRNHGGQDLLSPCGTPVVAAEGGTVRYTATDGSAGNYAVITGAETRRDYVYMHLRVPARVRKGQTVSIGQPLGEVGDTGNATACLLHFELWSAPGWYEGGTAVDPLPDLRAWDARDGAHEH